MNNAAPATDTRPAAARKLSDRIALLRAGDEVRALDGEIVSNAVTRHHVRLVDSQSCVLYDLIRELLTFAAKGEGRCGGCVERYPLKGEDAGHVFQVLWIPGGNDAVFEVVAEGNAY